MNRKIFILLLTICILLPTVSAATNIEIKTIPHHKVQITLFNEVNDEFFLLERLEEVSDENGEVMFVSSVESDFNLIVFVKNAGETVLSKKYSESYTPEKKIYLEILPKRTIDGRLFTFVLPVIFVLVVAFVSFKKTRKKSKKFETMEFSVVREGKRVKAGEINFFNKR